MRVIVPTIVRGNVDIFKPVFLYSYLNAKPYVNY